MPLCRYFNFKVSGKNHPQNCGMAASEHVNYWNNPEGNIRDRLLKILFLEKDK
jgi:hypothetical protein